MANPVDKVKGEIVNVKPVGIKDLIQASVAELGKALPAHMNPERLVRIALTTLRTTPKLMSCTPHSFLAALFQSAQLGLEPNIEGQAYIIPYGNEATFQIGYKGFVELFYRHQSSVSLDAQAVHENDSFDYQYGTAAFLSHKPALQNPGKVIAYYAIAKLKDGASVFRVMSVEECMEHGRKHSKAFNSSSSPWKSDPDAMCKKTVVIQIMKLIPKSIEIQKALAMDNTIKSKVAVDMLAVPDETDWSTTKEVPAVGAVVAPAGTSVPARENVPENESLPYEPCSSNSVPKDLRDDIVKMLSLMGRTLLDYTKSDRYSGTDDVNRLKETIGEGKKRSQLQVQHSIIKKDFLDWRVGSSAAVPEVDIDDSMGSNPE